MARARSLSEFQKAFTDEASCVAFLFKRRWSAKTMRFSIAAMRAKSSSSALLK